MTERRQELLKEALDAYGIWPEEGEAQIECLEQVEVMLDALHIHSTRGLSYGTVWKQYGAIANLLTAARKVDRLMKVWWFKQGLIHMHKDQDDAIDLINYICFFIRLARQDNLTGEPPDRSHVIGGIETLAELAKDRGGYEGNG